MPETRLEAVIFTLITAFMMVYCMTLYNMALAGIFTNETFWLALRGMWREFVPITLCAYLIASRSIRASERYRLLVQDKEMR